MTEKVDTQQDRFCALGRDEPTKKTNYCCYGIRHIGHGGDGRFCDNHKHLSGTREELWERAFAAGARAAVVEPACTCPEYWFPPDRREQLRKLSHGLDRGQVNHHKSCDKFF